MPKARSRRPKKRSFYGNRFKCMTDEIAPLSSDSTSKLKNNESLLISATRNDNCESEIKGVRLIDMQILISVLTVLCCPQCLLPELILAEDSKFGFCSNMTLSCKNCSFSKGFATTQKIKNVNKINRLFVLGMRLIGKGFSAAKKFCAIISLPCISKSSYRQQEKQLHKSALICAKQNMIAAANEIKKLKNIAGEKLTGCGVSVDGTWQRRGYSSLNGCVSVLSVDTGKILDVEIMSQYCRICSNARYFPTEYHTCSNHSGSAGGMEVVGVYRIFERSEIFYQLKYVEYYGDGDSKGFEVVKDMYGENSVVKLECIGHVQKRVGSRLRKLKKSKKGLGGKNKLTDKFIDKLQNYYGIAIRSNVGNLMNMQSACIAAFFHCCSGKLNQMHGQCPVGANSWCKFRRAEFSGSTLNEKSKGLPLTVINAIKKTYMDLCNQELLQRCLHGRTQNANESFNGLLWNIIPKETFVELSTLQLGINLAVILFNSGYAGLIPLFKELGLEISKEVLSSFWNIDKSRIADCKRHSMKSAKLARKKIEQFERINQLELREMRI